MEFNRKLTTQEPEREIVLGDDDGDDWMPVKNRKNKKGLAMTKWFAGTSPAAPPESQRRFAREEGGLATRYYSDPEDLEDILFNEDIIADPEKGIMKWLDTVYKNSRGFEMSTFHSSLMQIMWKKQSSKWENLALDFSSLVVSITHTYICDLLKGICADDRLRANFCPS